MARVFTRTLIPSLCALSMLAALSGCGADDPSVEENSISYGDGAQENTQQGSNHTTPSSSRNNRHQGDHTPASNNQFAPGNNTTPSNNASPNNFAPNNTIGAADMGAEPPPEEEPPTEPNDTEFPEVVENDFIDTSVEDTSTFSIDVDNASYTIMRQNLNAGMLPNPAGVRPEEYVNYFDYDYPEPGDDQAFSINLEVAPSKFGQDKHLIRIGVKGKDVSIDSMKHNNLVFLIDVSGSMQSGHKLDLVKESLASLMDNLRPDDTVGIVVYAGADGIILESTYASERATIDSAIARLQAGGSTNGEAGIVAAYDMAERHKVEGANNRVIILTDGDFNVGKRGKALTDYIATQRDRHISITCMGYGRGGYDDLQMENIAKEGNGNYYYVDTIEEAKRVFGPDLPSTLEVIAADVKIQVGFNADAVTRYRLIGYDNRVLDNDDFEDDSVDAGEIGPGHTVTAYYELELSPMAADQSILADVRVRHKSQYGASSTEFSRAIKMNQIQQSFAASSQDFQLAAAVLEFAEILRHSKHSANDRFDDILAIVNAQTGTNAKRSELATLIVMARDMWP